MVKRTGWDTALSVLSRNVNLKPKMLGLNSEILLYIPSAEKKKRLCKNMFITTLLLTEKITPQKGANIGNGAGG